MDVSTKIVLAVLVCAVLLSKASGETANKTRVSSGGASKGTASNGTTTDAKSSNGTEPASGTKSGDGIKPANETKTGDGTKSGDNTRPTNGTRLGDGTKPTSGTKPVDGIRPTDGTKSGDGTKPTNGTKPADSKPGRTTNSTGVKPARETRDGGKNGTTTARSSTDAAKKDEGKNSTDTKQPAIRESGQKNETGTEDPAAKVKDGTRQSQNGTKPLPTENGTKPSENRPKPSENGTKPSENRLKPSENGTKLSENRQKPSENGTKPSENRPKPSGNGTKPSEKRPKPSENGTKPSENRPKPSGNGTKPSEKRPKPSENSTKPSENRPKPSEHGSNRTKNDTSTGNRGKPSKDETLKNETDSGSKGKDGGKRLENGTSPDDRSKPSRNETSSKNETGKEGKRKDGDKGGEKPDSGAKANMTNEDRVKPSRNDSSRNESGDKNDGGKPDRNKGANDTKKGEGPKGGKDDGKKGGNNGTKGEDPTKQKGETDVDKNKGGDDKDKNKGSNQGDKIKEGNGEDKTKDQDKKKEGNVEDKTKEGNIGDKKNEGKGKSKKIKVPKIGKSTITREAIKQKEKKDMEAAKKLLKKSGSASAVKARAKNAEKAASRNAKKTAAGSCDKENSAEALAKVMNLLRDNPCLKKKPCNVIFGIASLMDRSERLPKSSVYGQRYFQCLNDPGVKNDAALLKTGKDNIKFVFGESPKGAMMKQGDVVKQDVFAFCSGIMNDTLAKWQCNFLGRSHKEKTSQKLSADDMKKIPESCIPQMSLDYTADTSAAAASLLDSGTGDRDGGEEKEPPSRALLIAAGEALLKGTPSSDVAKKIANGPLCAQLSCSKLKTLKAEDLCPDNTFKTVETGQMGCFKEKCKDSIGVLTPENMANYSKLLCPFPKKDLLDVIKKAKEKGADALYGAIGNVCNVEDCMPMDKLMEFANATADTLRVGQFKALTADTSALNLRCITKHLNLSEIAEVLTPNEFAGLCQTQGMSLWNKKKSIPEVRDAWLAVCRAAASQIPLCNMGDMALSATTEQIKAMTADDCNSCCSPLSSMLFKDDVRQALKAICFTGSPETITGLDIERCGSLLTEFTEEELKKIPKSEFASAAQPMTKDLDSLWMKAKVEVSDASIFTALESKRKRLMLALVDAMTPAGAKARRKRSAECTDCNSIQTLKSNLASFSVEKLSCLTKEVFDCALASLGDVPNYETAALDALATLAKTHIGTNLTKWTPMQVTQAGVILSAEAFAATLKDLPLESDEAILSLGKHNVWNEAKATAILTKRLADKSLTPATIVAGELKRLGHIVCGMTAAQIAAVKTTEFKNAARTIGSLVCLTDAQLKAWKAKAVEAFGAAETWKGGDIAELGLIIAGLDATEMGNLSPDQIASIGTNAIPKFPVDTFKSITVAQISALNTAQAQAVTETQAAALSAEQKSALDEVLGVKKEAPEDPKPADGKNSTEPSGGVTVTTTTSGSSNGTTGAPGETTTAGRNGTGNVTATTAATTKTNATTGGNGTSNATTTTAATTKTNVTGTTTGSAATISTTTEKSALVPRPTQPSVEDLKKKEEEAKKKAADMMKNATNMTPEDAKAVASNLGQISAAELEKIPSAVKTAVIKEFVKTKGKEMNSPEAKAAEVKMLKLGKGIAKNTDVANMNQAACTTFLDDNKDVVKYFPSSKQEALLDKADVNIDMVKKLSGVEMGEDFRNKLTQKYAKTLTATAVTSDQIGALSAECKASLPASFASQMPADVAKSSFGSIVQGSATVSKGSKGEKRPTTTVFALLGNQLTPADNLDAAAWKVILQYGLLGAMNFSDVQNASADKLCPKETGVHTRCARMCSLIFNKCRPIYGAVTKGSMDLYGDSVFQMGEADFQAITDESTLFELAKRWQRYRRIAQKTEYMNNALVTGLFKMLKDIFTKDSARLKDPANLVNYGGLLGHPSFKSEFKSLGTDVLKGVCQMQTEMPLMLASATITEMRATCTQAGVAYKDLGMLLLNMPVKDAEAIADADMYQALEAIALGAHDGTTRKAVADKTLAYALKLTSSNVETLPISILKLFNTLLGQFNIYTLRKINKETLQQLSTILATAFEVQRTNCNYRSKEAGFPASAYCSTGYAQEMKNILAAAAAPPAAGKRRKRNAATPTPVTCIDIVGLGNGVTYLTTDQLKTIAAHEFKDCASRLGNPTLAFDLAQIAELAKLAVKYWGDTSTWTQEIVRKAGGMVVGLSVFELDKLTIADLEAAMRIGTAQGWAILSSVDRDTKLSAAFTIFSKGVLASDIKTITGSHLRMISNLACGVSANKINSDIPVEAIGSSVIELGLLTTCTQNQLAAYAEKATQAHGKVPEPRDMQILIGGLTAKQLEVLKPSQIKELTPSTIENLPAAILIKFTKEQLEAFTPSMAARMTVEQRKALPEEKREVILKILKDNLPAEAVKDTADNSAVRASYNSLIVLTVSAVLLLTSWKGSML